MGEGAILIIYGVILVAGLIAGYVIASRAGKNPEQQDMSPQTLEAMKTTTAEEGTVVPWILGYARLAGNILAYDNLVTEKIVEVIRTGGKGGGSKEQEVMQGYKYFLDMWQAICIGPDVEILQILAQDKPSDYAPTIFNPGDLDVYPEVFGRYAGSLNPVAHVFFSKMYIGDNTTYVPTLHFLVRRLSNSPITNANRSNGVNPAAAIHQILIEAGAAPNDFNYPSFQEAANYWESKGYGISVIVNRQEEVRNIINHIFTFVDGNIRQDENDRFELKAWRETDTPVAYLDEEDYFDFEFVRKTWDDVYTDFRANFTDREQAYTTRTIRARNSAVRRLVGQEKPISIDLTAYGDVDTASKRLWEMMKKLSYPEASVQATVPVKYDYVKIGDVVSLSHADYGLEDMSFRLLNIDVEELDSNKLKWMLSEKVEGHIGEGWRTGGGSFWEPMMLDPSTAIKFSAFEMPENPITGKNPCFLFLCARRGPETSFRVLTSRNSSGDFQPITNYAQMDSSYDDGMGNYISSVIWRPIGEKRFSQFSMYGKLIGGYSSDTYQIDDEVGVIVDVERDDPVFTSLSRTELFSAHNILIIGQEMMAFQTIEPWGSTSWKITGVVRGIFNTPIQNHNADADVWVTRIDDNIWYQNKDAFTAGNYYFKMQPVFQGEYVSDEVSPVSVNFTDKVNSSKPFNQIMAVRSGDTITIHAYPYSYVNGAGVKNENNQNIRWSVFTPYAGFFGGTWDTVERLYLPTQRRINGGAAAYINLEENNTYTLAGSHTLELRTTKGGFEADTSSWLSVSVGAMNGEYFSSSLPNTGLELIPYGTVNFIDIMNRNTERLNVLLDSLELNDLFDVYMPFINEANFIFWNNHTKRFENTDRPEPLGDSAYFEGDDPTRNPYGSGAPIGTNNNDVVVGATAYSPFVEIQCSAIRVRLDPNSGDITGILHSLEIRLKDYGDTLGTLIWQSEPVQFPVSITGYHVEEFIISPAITMYPTQEYQICVRRLATPSNSNYSRISIIWQPPDIPGELGRWTSDGSPQTFTSTNPPLLGIYFRQHYKYHFNFRYYNFSSNTRDVGRTSSLFASGNAGIIPSEDMFLSAVWFIMESLVGSIGSIEYVARVYTLGAGDALDTLLHESIPVLGSDLQTRIRSTFIFPIPVKMSAGVNHGILIARKDGGDSLTSYIALRAGIAVSSGGPTPTNESGYQAQWNSSGAVNSVQNDRIVCYCTYLKK